MLLHANGSNWVNKREHQILIVSGRVLKQCYLHNNMDDDNNIWFVLIIISVEITVNYHKCIGYWNLNQYDYD